MKQRLGFVSNSSSSCYILDLCDTKTQTIVKKLKRSCIESYGVGRETGFAIGKDAIKYAKDWIEEAGDYNDRPEDSLGEWILDTAKQLGEENTVFIRISDEDNGIPCKLPEDLIYAEREYH